jgi:hypothetical protein
VAVTDVGPSGNIRMEAYASADNGEFHYDYTNSNGASVFYDFSAAPGASFYLRVCRQDAAGGANPYTFNATHVEVPDSYEPNDTRLEASLIEVGQAGEAYMLGDRVTSTAIPNEAWFDWYQVALEPGDRSVRGEHPVKPAQRVPGGRHPRGEPRHERDRLHHPVCLPSPGLAQLVGDPAVGEPGPSLEAERRAGAVAQEPLAPLAIVLGHGHAGKEIEAARLRSTARGLRRAGGLEVVARSSGAVGTPPAGAGELGQLAKTERALEACVERGPLRRLVGEVPVGSGSPQQAPPSQPAGNAVLDSVHEVVEDGRRRARQRVERDRSVPLRTPRAFPRKDAVRHRDGVVHVEVEAAGAPRPPRTRQVAPDDRDP